MMTDPIADMLHPHPQRDPASSGRRRHAGHRLKVGIAKVLKEEGFILDYQVGHFASPRTATTSSSRRTTRPAQAVHSAST